MAAPDDIPGIVAEPQMPRRFVTGVGQSDTHAVVLSDGRANPHAAAGTDYTTITGAAIAAMVAAPQEVAKPSARWFIPSTYIAYDARDHTAQRERGSFFWFCVDVDGGNLALDVVRDTLAAVAPGASRLVYSTRSSSAEALRWRALLPLKQPLPGSDYTDTALAFFALLQEASGGALVADRKLALTGQLVYLPNRGAHYEHEVFRGAQLDLTPDHPVIRRREAERAAAEAARREAADRRALTRKTALARPSDGETPVARFNAAYTVTDLLQRYGYLRLGQTDSWRSPHQTSGTFATRDYGSYWVSLSGSDDAVGLGSASSTGARFGDGFDLYVAYEHGGKFDDAVKAYGQEADQLDMAATLARVTHPQSAAGTTIKPILQTDQNNPISALEVPGPDNEATAASAIRNLPTAFAWIEPAQIPPRPWIYGRHLLRQQVSVTVAPGGVGKSSNSIVEALAIASGRPLLGEWVCGPLRTWIYNLEDPADELQRRITAAMIHHKVGPEALGGRLFVDSGRDRPLCTAAQVRSSTAIDILELEAMTAEILERGIDVLIVDPFVSSHQVNENDNGAIDLVAKQYWAVLAQRCNCAIELVHHTRKLGGEEGTSESARGASALLGAARSGRALNRMTAEDRERAGIGASDTSVYFALGRDKANMAPPGNREWRRVVSVELGNGDNVGVVEKWNWPDDFADLSGADLFKVQQAIDAWPEPLRFSDQSSPWVGEVIAATLGLVPHSDKKRIKRMIETWLKAGALKKCVVKDDARRDRPCVEVGDWAK